MSEENLSAEEAELQAKKKAMRLLEYADRTEKQLRDKLKEGEFPPSAIDAAIEYVKAFHYLDDRRYAENYVRGHAGRKSRYELKQELRLRGVSDAYAEEALLLAEGSGELDEAASVSALFLKKYAHKDLGDPKLYEKAFRYFATKGYAYDVIKRGLEQALSESYEDGAFEDNEFE